MASLRGVLVGLLVAGIVTVTSLGASSWRDKVAPSVLRWVDSGSSEERVILLHVDDGSGTRSSAAAYAVGSHRAWLLSWQEGAAEVSRWARLENSFSLRRSSGSTWELGLPYLHGSSLLIARGSATGIRQIAQLGFVLAVSDGAAPVPTPPPYVGDAVAAASAIARPSDLFTRSSATTEDLGTWMAALGWRYVAREDVVYTGDSESWFRLSTPSLVLEASAYDLVGFALCDAERETILVDGSSLPVALDGASWAPPGDPALTVSRLAQLLEAMDQTGADGVAIAPIAVGDGPASLYALLRAGGEGWASLTAPGPGTSTTQDALPRGDAPAEIAATHGSYADQILVQWQPAAGAPVYEILRARSAGGPYEPIAIASGGEFVDRGVETCVQYSYLARSISDGGLGAESERAVGYVGHVPMPPERIWTDGGTSGGAIRVEWTPVENATLYRLMRTQPMSDKPNVAAQQYAIYVGPEPQFLDTDVVAGQTYLYRAFAGNGCGYGELSPQAKGMALYELPAGASLWNPPAWIEATRGRPYGLVMLSWRAVPQADSYRILRSLSYQGPYEAVAETSSTSWEDRDVVLCGDYWYRIQTLGDGKEGPPSVTVYGSYGYRPEAPQDVRASAGIYTNSIEITWDPMEDALYYNVHRAPDREGPFAPIATAVPGTRYIDEGLSPGQEFWYKVKAANPCGCSGDLGAAFGATAGG